MGNCACGACGCRPYLDDSVIGAYSYNKCGMCCFTPLWTCPGCDGKEFEDPSWDTSTMLRRGFDDFINGPELEEVMMDAPKACQWFCGGCRDVTQQAPAINDKWCPMVNEKLLHPAGYRCEAYFWITYGGKGERHEHMVIMVKKK